MRSRPRRLLAVLTCAALGLAMLGGCGDDVKQQAKDLGKTIGEKAGATWNSVKEFSAEKKDQAVELFSKSKDTLAEQFEKAKEKSADWSEDAKTALDGKWVAVQETYGKAKDAGADGWETSRDAFVEAYEAFKRELAKHGN